MNYFVRWNDGNYKKDKMKNIKYFLVLLSIPFYTVFAQSVEGNVDNLPVRTYTLTIKQAMVNKAEKEVKGMTINGTIPGPTLEFTEGEYAVIYGWVNDLPTGDNFAEEITWSAGIEYFLSRDFSLMGSYDNRFGAGGGLSIRF